MPYQEPKLPQPNETDIRNISGLVQSSGNAPTGAPRNFYQQLRIVSGVFYFYDAVLNAWHSTVGSFLGLTDTPNAYTGQASKIVAVKGDESGLEFVDASAAAVGGNDTELQFNDGGALGGANEVTWDKTSGDFTVGDISNNHLRINRGDGVFQIRNSGTNLVQLDTNPLSADRNQEFPDSDGIFVVLAGTGASAPGTTPTAIGLMFIDTSAGKVYVSTGTSNSGDWKALN